MAKQLANIKYVMDASAIIAVANQELYMPELPDMFINSVITTFNLAEVLTTIIRKFNIDTDAIATLWNELGNFVKYHYPLDDELSYEVVNMTPFTKQFGLSMGDRYCLALAKILKLPVYTADKIWKQLEELLNISINLIR